MNTNVISPLGDQQYLSAADTRQQNVDPTERLKIEIIERPKELKVFVKKEPMKKLSPKGEDINKLKQLGEIINKVKLESTDGDTLSEGEKMYVIKPKSKFFLSQKNIGEKTSTNRVPESS